MKTRHARDIRAGIHWGRHLAVFPRRLVVRVLTKKGSANDLQYRAARRTYGRIERERATP